MSEVEKMRVEGWFWQAWMSEVWSDLDVEACALFSALRDALEAV